MSKSKDNVPATLRTIRERLGLSQEQLAERLSVSFATVNRWEGGKSKPQRAQMAAIEALAEGVQADLDLDGLGDARVCCGFRAT